MATLTLPPDYFRTAADRYRSNPTDRYEWLQDQITKTRNSLIQYQSELIALQNEMIKLGVEKGSSGQAAAIGTVLAVIPTGYTQVVGGLMIVGSTFFAKAENKQKVKRIDDLKFIGTQISNEAVQIGRYYDRYRNELLMWQLIPMILIFWILIR